MGKGKGGSGSGNRSKIRVGAVILLSILVILVVGGVTNRYNISEIEEYLDSWVSLIVPFRST